MERKQITPEFTAGTQMSIKDIQNAANDGFATIINNRPDGEMLGQPSSASLADAAEQAGLAYVHIPVRGGSVTEVDIQSAIQALTKTTGPVLGFCRSEIRLCSRT